MEWDSSFWVPFFVCREQIQGIFVSKINPVEWLFGKKQKVRSGQEVLQSKHFCMMPFVHLHITQDGLVTPCCQAPWEAKQALGDINKQPLAEIWNSDSFQAFRKQMLQDKPDARCTRCYEKEASGWRSLRQITNEDYQAHAPAKLQKLPPPPVYFDIRFTNLCNLKCRICGPWASSQWHADAVALGMVPAGSRSLSVASDDEDGLLGQLGPWLATAEEIYFAGGEPLIMEQHYKLLDRLVKAGNTSVRLKYNTNLSKPGIKDRNVISYWKKFQQVHVAASLDAYGLRGELLRKGQSWAETEALMAEIKKQVPWVKLFISPTVYALNVLHLPEFHQTMVSKGLIDPEAFIPSLLIQPEPYNIRVLPAPFKTKVNKVYRKHLEWLKAQQPQDHAMYQEVLRKYADVMEHLNSADHSHLLPDLKTRIQRLDSLRGERTAETFPELEFLRD